MNILVTGAFRYQGTQVEQLKAFGNVILMPQESDNLPIEAKYIDAVICNALFLHHNIDDFISLKYVQLTSAGMDRVPMRKISERGIEIHNARGVYSIPMAEWAIFRVLEHYKQGWFFRKEQTSGTWGKNRNLREIYGSKVAIIGAGNVGQEVAKRFACMGCNVSGFDIHVNPTPFFDNMYLTTTLQEHISEFNIVVVTAPLLPSTKGLVSRAVLEKLKLNATLINIARGGLIDEPAMCEILAQREDLFAALDVFECEPLPEDSKLWHLPNIAISPHNSFVSNGNNERLFSIIYTNIKNFLNNTK